MYEPLVACPNDHVFGALCGATTPPNDICYTARSQAGQACCRTPCSLQQGDGGVVVDDTICETTVHPDSRCVRALGFGSEPDRDLCSIPCNPFDDVGCPGGLNCPVGDSDISAIYTDCLELEDDPRHHLEPC